MCLVVDPIADDLIGPQVGTEREPLVGCQDDAVRVGTLLARKSRAMKKIRESLSGTLLDMEAHDDD